MSKKKGITESFEDDDKILALSMQEQLNNEYYWELFCYLVLVLLITLKELV